MAEQDVKKRAISKNFSLSEIEAIKNGVTSEINIINAKHCNGASAITKKMQDASWFKVLNAVNAVGHCHRSIAEVKEKWRGMTKQAKAEVTAQRISSQKTGGGPPLPPMSSVMSFCQFCSIPRYPWGRQFRKCHILNR